MAAALWDLYGKQKAKGLAAAMRQTLAKIEKSGQADHRWFNAMGELALSEGNHSLAARFFRHARDENPLPEYEINLGNALYAVGDYPGARHVLEAYRARFPGDMHGLIDLANCHLRLGDLAKARELCAEGLKQKRAKAPLWNCLGEIAHIEGDDAAAWDLFDKAYGDAPDYVDALFNRANMAYRLGRADEALEDFALCLRKDENFEAALFNSAVIRLEQGRTADAREAAERLLRLNPGHSEGRHLLGRIQFAAQEYRAARETFQDLIKRDENHIPTLLALARLHLQEAEPSRAAAMAKRVLARNGLTEEDFLACLAVLLEAGEYEACRDRLRAVPDDALGPQARKLLVLAAWKLGRTLEAIGGLEAVLAAEGETAENLALLGRMLRQSGARDLAEGRLRKALDLEPGCRAAAFELAGVLLDGGEGERAVEVLEMLLASRPEDPDCLYNLACCLARNRKYADSLQYLKRAVDHGFRELDKIQADTDLEGIRELEEYRQLAVHSGLN